MTTQYGNAAWPHLFSPFRLGSLDLPNRTIVAPMTRISADPDGVPTDQMVGHYAEFARGGFALIVTEGAHIDTAQSQGYRDQPGIATPAQIEGWRRVVEAVHDAGARIVLQILHAGALSQENRYTGETIAPSAIQPVGAMAARYYGDGPFKMPREMTLDDIETVIGAFEQAASNAMTAGFDGVEIHGANGYLPDQFLTTYTNTRSDEYGGSLENRLRFHRAITAAMVRGVAGRGLAGIRISQSKTNDRGHQWEGGVADAQAIFSGLAAEGAGYIHISTHQGLVEVFDSGHTLAGLAHEFTDVPVIGCGKLDDPQLAEKLIATGEADLIAMAKGAIADPHWPAKVAAGEAPLPFDPGMISPIATLDATAAWRAENNVSFVA